MRQRNKGNARWALKISRTDKAGREYGVSASVFKLELVPVSQMGSGEGKVEEGRGS